MSSGKLNKELIALVDHIAKSKVRCELHKIWGGNTAFLKFY